jgi:PhnB protein
VPNPIPEGYHTITPYLLVSDVAALMEFLTKAYGATERGKLAGPDGLIVHAEMLVGNSIVMMGQPEKAEDIRRTMLHMYVPDVDAAYQRCLAAGAVSVREPKNQFYGDRSGSVKDPTGNDWYIATHVEDVSMEEMERRMKAQQANA